MRKILFITAVVALSACTQKAAEPANDANVALANDAMGNDAMATPAAFDIKGTSWEYVDPKTKKAVQESVDANGNYITTAGTEHVDHGTAVMKDGKACFTSAMTKDGEMCWTDPKLADGASGETVNAKGEKLAIKRVAYTPKTM